MTQPGLTETSSIVNNNSTFSIFGKGSCDTEPHDIRLTIFLVQLYDLGNQECMLPYPDKYTFKDCCFLKLTLKMNYFFKELI